MWESQETIDFSETTSCKIRVLCMAGLVGFAANVAMSHHVTSISFTIPQTAKFSQSNYDINTLRTLTIAFSSK